MEIHPLKAEFLHGDRHDGAASPLFFGNFAKAPKNQQHKNVKQSPKKVSHTHKM
jgi:hypothetical protein